MAWVTVPGLAGKVYLPDDADQPPKKHPCKTCFSCQWCDETRCRVCRGDTAHASTHSKSPICCKHRIQPSAKNPKNK